LMGNKYFWMICYTYGFIIGRRFDPLKLPGRSPPLWDDFFPDPFPRTYGPQ
jgi:hypothetical protein